MKLKVPVKVKWSREFFSQIFDVATLPGDHLQGDLVTSWL